MFDKVLKGIGIVTVCVLGGVAGVVISGKGSITIYQEEIHD